MAVYFKEGETKIRPGLYQRYSNTVTDAVSSARDGVCAIPVQANWGPLGVVLKNNNGDLVKNYGSGEYESGYTVPAAQAMFDGGAATVYTYRMGSGGAKATLDLKNATVAVVTATAKYEGTMPLAVSIQPKIGDDTKKELCVYANSSLVETFTFAADTTNEPANLVKASKDSQYIDFTLKASANGAMASVAVAAGDLTGGTNPTVTNEDYSKAFAAFESFYYNVLALDVDDDETITKALLLQTYLDNAHQLGKFGMGVVGEKSSVSFATRLEHAKAFNNEKIVYLGSGYKTASGTVDGVMAICYFAGVIAATPANRSITHTVIKGATDLVETFTFSDYEDAILHGMVLPSMSNDGSIWYDSAVNTLTEPDYETQDDGWKKIRRTKTRFELFYRLDTMLAPKVGKVNCDTDGIADIIQGAGRVLTAMEFENKIAPGATFALDESNPPTSDSAWFVIDATDYDSLEKIYLHYRFSYSQAS